MLAREILHGISFAVGFLSCFSWIYEVILIIWKKVKAVRT